MPRPASPIFSISTLLRLLACPLSALYSSVMNIRNWLYDRKIFRAQDAGVTVVSVGNLTLGGTGKTPIVCELLRWAVENHLSPAVISRGYKGEFETKIARVKPGANPAEYGDEPTMMANLFSGVPIYVGNKRMAVTRELLNAHPDVRLIFADDAFQHRQLHRDIDIVIIDCTEPLKNYSVIPAGRGRENIKSLRRASCIILNKVNLVSPEQKQNVIEFIDEILDGRSTPVIESEYHVRRLIRLDDERAEELHEFEPVTLVSGIGNPAAFEALVAKNLDVKKHFKFRDHHRYTRGEFEKILSESRDRKVKRVVTTEKDAVKLREFLKRDRQDGDFFWKSELRPKLSLRVKWLYEKILERVH